MNLRPYTSADLAALVALDDQCFEPPFRFTRPSMKGFAEAKNACVVVADCGDELAGFCILHVELSRRRQLGYIVTLDVARLHRRKGLATKLMRAVERMAAADGCGALHLHVHIANVAAISFYKRLGFQSVAELPDFYAPGLDALAMRLALANGESD